MDLGSSLGSIGGALGGIAGGLITNAGNKREAERNRNWQAYMSNTSHQREVEDLKKAVLNPLLSGTGGSGASTPTGAMATMENVIAPAVASAMDAARLRKDMDVADANILNQTASAKKSNTEANLTAAQIAVLEKQMPAIISKARADKLQHDWDAKSSDFDNILKRVQGTIGTIPVPGKGLKHILPKRN